MTGVKDICVKSGTAILEVMKIIENSSQKIALIINEQKALIGTVTDGDIRRGLIKNIQISQSVDLIMNTNPTTLPVGSSAAQIKKAMAAKKISQLPILNPDRTVSDLVLVDHIKNMTPKENTVVLMAGGLGARLGELTSSTPKPMLKVGDKPILEIVIENLKEHGFSNFVLAVNYKAEIIENYFKDGSDFGIQISYLKEKERLGTAGALSLLDHKNDLPLIVMNADVLTKVNFSQFLENHINNHFTTSMCVRKYDFQIPFGVVHVDDHRIVKIEEKPTQSYFVNAGVYILNSECLQLIPKQTFFDMPSLFNLVSEKSSSKSGAFPVHEYWIDVGRRDDLNQAQEDFKKVF